jgi:hypothetical protein
MGLLERRVRQTKAPSATSRPVYLSPGKLISIVEAAGLRYLPDQSGHQPRDFLLVAEKPPAGSPALLERVPRE